MQYNALSILPLATDDDSLTHLNDDAMKRASINLTHESDELSKLIVKMNQIRNRVIKE